MLNQGQGKMPQEYMDYLVMKEMGWSYEQLMECPNEVVNNIVRYLNTESRFLKERSK